MDKEKLRLYIGSKIKDLRKNKNITQGELGRLTGVKNNTISAYERGVISADQDVLFKLAEVLNVSIDDFFPSRDETDDKSNDSTSYTYYPVYVSAGSTDYISGVTNPSEIDISDIVMGKHAGNKDLFVTKINGESMNKVIPNESLIVVLPTNIDTLKNGDIVIYNYDNELAVKRYYNHGNEVVFRPDSHDMSFIDQKIDLNNGVDLEIIGKVVLYTVEL